MDGEELVDHPAHYGGGDNPYEHIKVSRAWGLNYELGCCTKYICRAGKKSGAPTLRDLKKAAWYLQAEIERRESEFTPTDLQNSHNDLETFLTRTYEARFGQPPPGGVYMQVGSVNYRRTVLSSGKCSWKLVDSRESMTGMVPAETIEVRTQGISLEEFRNQPWYPKEMATLGDGEPRPLEDPPTDTRAASGQEGVQ